MVHDLGVQLGFIHFFYFFTLLDQFPGSVFQALSCFFEPLFPLIIVRFCDCLSCFVFVRAWQDHFSIFIEVCASHLNKEGFFFFFFQRKYVCTKKI